MHSPNPQFRPFLRSESGSTIVEFALVLPVALLLLFGMVQCSIALFDFCSATFACRVAARYASLHSASSVVPATAGSIESTARKFLWGTPGTVSVSSSWAPSNVVGGMVTVTIREDLPLSIPFSSISSFTVGSTTQRVIQH